METKLKSLKQKANSLPLTPGVYIMKDKSGKIIYIGKAKALKNRVTQYFGSNTNHTTKVIRMVSQVDDFEYILCDTEYEALLLESNLIKKHLPKYNILLKDDKGYHYIKVTYEAWPKIKAVMQKEKDRAEYIGPYYSFYIARDTVDEILKLFKLPNCNRSFDTPSKPCLNYHIGLCNAPCKGNISKDEYLETVTSAVDFIKKGEISASDVCGLKQKMETAAEELDFELAARLRDRIRAIEKSHEKQKIISSVHKSQDVFAIATAGDTAAVSVLIFRNGRLSDKKVYYIDEISDKETAYSEILCSYYSENEIPPEIAVDADFEDKYIAAELFSSVLGRKVSISVPERGTQKQIVDMCAANAAEALSKRTERSGKEVSALNELSELLGLKTAPRRIEAYDISNTAGNENVASMIVFINGRPEKAFYRKFKIKSFVGQDDFRSMNEVLDRRFSEYRKGEDQSFKEMPDLILLDGGRGQISAVLPLWDKYSLNIPLFGMVKDSKHRTSHICTADRDIALKATKQSFNLVTKIQDEVHRFAITYHKQRRKISTLQMELMNISGVGDATAKKLFSRFKTVKAIRSATVDELKAAGISKKTAENIFNYYSG